MYFDHQKCVPIADSWYNFQKISENGLIVSKNYNISV